MTTGSMPNPPDQPTSQIPPANSASTTPPSSTAQPSQPSQQAAAEAAPQAPFDLAADLARILNEQADSLAQKLNYHTQMMFGVGALGIDIVNARNSVLVVANALSNRSHNGAVYTLTNVGTAQYPQINDGTLPFRNNSQVAGLLEGIILDAAMQAYRDNTARQTEARLLLESISQAANEQIEHRRGSLALSPSAAQGPGAGPNARS